MTKQINALFDALDLQLCEKAYNELERSQPNIVQTIEAMVKRGVKPVEIRSQMSDYSLRFLKAMSSGCTLSEAYIVKPNSFFCLDVSYLTLLTKLSLLANPASFQSFGSTIQCPFSENQGALRHISFINFSPFPPGPFLGFFEFRFKYAILPPFTCVEECFINYTKEECFINYTKLLGKFKRSLWYFMVFCRKKRRKSLFDIFAKSAIIISAKTFVTLFLLSKSNAIAIIQNARPIEDIRKSVQCLSNSIDRAFLFGPYNRKAHDICLAAIVRFKKGVVL